jgi:hypothetical protein
MRSLLLAACILLAATACEANRSSKPSGPRVEVEPAPVAAEASRVQSWTFDDTPPGAVAPGVRVAETGGRGTPATWSVVADPSAPSPPHAFGVTASTNTKKTYNLALVEDTRLANVDLQVMIRAVSGELNRGGGLVWRAKGENDYYLARWDPTEDNVYIYLVEGGARTALAKVDLEIDHDAWHALRVVASGSRIELYIDDAPVLTADDATLKAPGMIGLWTKSDALSRFDDLSAAAP